VAGRRRVVAWCAAVAVGVVLVVLAVVLLNRPSASRVAAVKPTTPAPEAPAQLASANPLSEPPVVAPPAVPRVVNLLRLIDPERDTFSGTWRLHTGEFAPQLSSDGTQHARLNIPYEPPEEYDFRVDFTRTGGDNCMAQMFTHKHPCALILFGWKGTVSGFQLIRNQFADHNVTGVRDLSTANGQRHTSIVCVRRKFIEAWFDGQMIIHYDTDGSELSSKDWAINTALGVGSQTSPTLFHTIELKEITGKGHALR
jgi:hypothetical protein